MMPVMSAVFMLESIETLPVPPTVGGGYCTALLGAAPRVPGAGTSGDTTRRLGVFSLYLDILLAWLAWVRSRDRSAGTGRSASPRPHTAPSDPDPRLTER